MPSAAAAEFNCKYIIRSTRQFFYGLNDTKDYGYIHLTIEQYGFDEDVYVIVMPYLKFVDNTHNFDHSESKVFKSKFGSNYLIPAENDILISFAPVAKTNSTELATSPTGKIRLKAQYQLNATEEQWYDGYTIIAFREGERPEDYDAIRAVKVREQI